MDTTRVLCFVCGLYAYLTFTVQAGYVARDLSCAESNLHSRPYSNEATVTVYLSIEDSYSRRTPPICRLAVRVPRIINMYQTMKLAMSQHNRLFNFSAKSDEEIGFTIQHIDGIWTRQRQAVWVLYDGDTGRPISTSITQVMMEDRRSYIWVYEADTPTENSREFTGSCTTRTAPIYGSTPAANIKVLYLSVQFWSNVWPVCKIPVLFEDDYSSGVNLNDLMMEGQRQYRHLFSFQRYQNYEIFDINELYGNDQFSWRAQVADEERELNDVLYMVPLQDGNHVIWRYVNNLGEARLKTVKPEPTFGVDVTPPISRDDDTPDDRHENDRGTVESRTGGGGNTAGGRYIPWTIILISALVSMSL